MTPEHQAEIDAAIKKASAELHVELARGETALEAWVVAHPLPAFRVGTVGGILLGGFTIYLVIRLFS